MNEIKQGFIQNKVGANQHKCVRHQWNLIGRHK